MRGNVRLYKCKRALGPLFYNKDSYRFAEFGASFDCGGIEATLAVNRAVIETSPIVIGTEQS